MKRFLKLCLIVTLVPPAIIFAYYVWVFISVISAILSGEDGLAHYKIANTKFNIPVNYLFLSPIKQDEEALSIFFLYPDMSPRDGEHHKKFSAPGGGNVISVLLTKNHYWNAVSADMHKGIIENSDFGLIRTKKTKPVFIPEWTYFIGPGDENYSDSLFTCQPDGLVPQCQVLMKYKDLYVDISYRQALLRHWKGIRNSTVALLQKLEVENGVNCLPSCSENLHNPTESIKSQTDR